MHTNLSSLIATKNTKDTLMQFQLFFFSSIEKEAQVDETFYTLSKSWLLRGQSFSSLFNEQYLIFETPNIY